MFYSKDQLKGFISEGLFLVSVKVTCLLKEKGHDQMKPKITNAHKV